MSIINIDLSDTVASWRNKSNQLAINVGDLALLTTLVDSNIVAAINYLDSSIGTVSTLQAAIDSSNDNFVTRVRTAVSVTDAGGDGSLSYNDSNGIFTYTGPSALEVRAHLSVTDAGGDGSLSYNNTTGVITYTGPSAAEVRAHFSAGEGIDIASGVISGEDASTTNKGIASFNSTRFSVSSGAVDIASGGIASGQLASVQTLVIYDSTGAAVKTLYAAGS